MGFFVDHLVKFLHIMSAGTQRFDYPGASLTDNGLIGPRVGRGYDWKSDVQPIVRTPLGEYEGYSMKVLGGRDVFAFEGIPFAEPPGRFKEAKLKRPFEGTFIAKHPGPECTQLFAPHILSTTPSGAPLLIGSEDCLTCNVYTPTLPFNGTNPKFPVVFHVHGGGFEFGKGHDYGPAYLMERDMVVVNCQYRLGILGFLTTGDKVAPGNLGLKDVRTSVDWVYNNIAYFGGDPGKIILHGVSAGGALSHLLAISPYGHEGKISGVIAGSGNAGCPWALDDQEDGAKIAKTLGILSMCPTQQGSQALVACLRKRSPQWLLLAQNYIRVSEGRVSQFFGPTVEPRVPGALITDLPELLYTRGKVAKIPIVFYTAARDVDVMPVGWFAATTLRFPTKVVIDVFPEMFQYRGRVNGKEKQVTEKILRFYGGRDKVTKNREVLLTIMSDAGFNIPTLIAMYAHAILAKAPTYGMVYSYRSKRVGIGPRFHVNRDDILTTHGECEFMIYNRTDFKYLTKKDADYPVMQKWQEIFMNFANKGKLEWKEGNKLVQLKPIEGNEFQLLDFGTSMKIDKSILMSDKAKFWYNLQRHELRKRNNGGR